MLLDIPNPAWFHAVRKLIGQVLEDYRWHRNDQKDAKVTKYIRCAIYEQHSMVSSLCAIHISNLPDGVGSKSKDDFGS